MRIARSSWTNAGLETFLGLQVPYAATSSGRLSDDAVQLVVETLRGGKPDHDYRFLELGAGSGIFARLFLDRLAETAPDIYASCRYLVTDGNASMLESLRSHGVLDAHDGHVDMQVLDAGSAWPDRFSRGFDGIFGTYLLDSLPVEILTVGADGVQRMQARSCLPDAQADKAENLKAALAKPGIAHLTEHLTLGKRLNIQTRHADIDPATLPYADALPDQSGETTPMVHCIGALACMENAARALRKGGVAMFADYGTTAPRDPSDIIEFQSFGKSAAHAVNFHQIDSYFEARTDTTLVRPQEEDGFLVTRVLYNGAHDDLFELVDLLFGETRYNALTLPIEAAREMLRANAFQAARKYYAKAMVLQPYNWSLAEEVAELLLLSAEDFDDAADLARFGLNLNPFSPSLLRILADALFQSGDISSALKSVDKSLALNGADSRTHLVHAHILAKQQDYPAALTAIANGLAYDPEAEYREELIGFQDEVLVKISVEARDALINQVNRLRDIDGLPE